MMLELYGEDYRERSLGFSLRPVVDSSTSALWPQTADFAFVNNVYIEEPTLEEILRVLDDYGEPIFLRLSPRISIYLDDFELDEEMEKIREAFERFVGPLWQRIRNGSSM